MNARVCTIFAAIALTTWASQAKATVTVFDEMLETMMEAQTTVAQAQSATWSDTLGVRSRTHPSSLTANLKDFLTSSVVPDATINEGLVGGIEPPATIQFDLSGLVLLGTNDTLHTNVTGWAYVFEKDGKTVSDAISLEVSENFKILSWTLTLYSDPISSVADIPPAPSGFIESGLLQDISGALFVTSGMITPVDPALGVQVPFNVVVASDVDPVPVPEPESYAMLLAGLGLLGFMSRRRKQRESA